MILRLLQPLFASLILVFCVSVAPLCASPIAASSETAAARAGIQSAYEQINAAFSQHDLTRTMSYFAPDYLVVDEKGAKFNKDQTQHQYQQQLGQIKSMHSRYVIQGVTPQPGGTLVEMKLHMDGVGEKRILFVKVRGTFTDDLWVRDLWINTPQGWRLKARQTLQDDMRIHH